MEALHSILRNEEQNALYFSSMDTEALIHFLRGRDYCIEEMWEIKDLPDGSFEEKQLGWPDEEPEWVRSEHSGALNWLMETFESHSISILFIKLDNGGFIRQDYGEFSICFGKGADLKTPALRVLEMYGYFAGEEIWALSGQHNIMLPIEGLIGYESNEITKEQLDAVVRNGQSIIEEHKKLDAMIAEDKKKL